MKIITNTEELKTEFLTELPEDQRKGIHDKYQDMLTRETTADLVAEICEALTNRGRENPEDKAEIDTWTPIDRMLWIVKEAYIVAVLNTMDIIAEANTQGMQKIIDAQAERTGGSYA